MHPLPHTVDFFYIFSFGLTSVLTELKGIHRKGFYFTAALYTEFSSICLWASQMLCTYVFIENCCHNESFYPSMGSCPAIIAIIAKHYWKSIHLMFLLVRFVWYFRSPLWDCFKLNREIWSHQSFSFPIASISR